MLFSQDVPDVLGGVSQFPPEHRTANQAEALENALLSPTHGMMIRPPTEYVGRLGGVEGWGDAFIHAVNRTPTERYTVAIVNGDLKVFDTLTGTEQTVLFPSGKDYLVAGPRGFRATTVGDYTFIANRQVEVKRGSKRAPGTQHEAIVFVRQVDYATDYSVTINGSTVVTRTVAEEEAQDRGLISTEAVAKALYDAMALNPQIRVAFDIERYGSTIYLKRDTGADFTITSMDGLADKGLRVVKGSVQSIADLPLRAKQGMLVEVTGDPGSPKDNLWVRYEAGEAGADGVWRECPAPNVLVDLDASTMPHALVRQGAVTGQLKSRIASDSPQAVTSGAANHTQGPLPPTTPVGSENVKAVFTALPSAITDAPVATLKVSVSIQINQDVPWEIGVVLRDAADRLVWLSTPRRVDFGQYVPFSSPEVDATGLTGALTLQLYVNEQDNPPTEPIDATMMFAAIEANAGNSVTIELPDHNLPAGWICRVNAHWSSGTTHAYSTPGASTDRTPEQAAAAISFGSIPWASVSVDGRKITIATPNDPAPGLSVEYVPHPHYAWVHGASLTPDAFIGYTLKNLTTGATAEIIDNDVESIRVASPGIPGGFSAGDRLVIQGAPNTFVFGPQEWGERLVGTDDTAPFPGFVDQQINEVFFHRGRLGFTAGEYVTLSASGDVFRFFRRTTAQLLDDDPIDVRNAHKDVAMFDAALGWASELYLFSGSGHQFRLTGEPVLSPATVRLEHVSSLPYSEKVRPIPFGLSAVFPRESGGFVQMFEASLDQDGGVQAEQTTRHVREYIEGSPVLLTGDAELGMLVVGTRDPSGPREDVYVHMSPRIGGQPLMNGWCRWTFPGAKVLAADMQEGVLYLVMLREGGGWPGVYLERINCALPPGPGEDFLDAGSIPYTFRWVWSPLYLRDGEGRAQDYGRLQVRQARIRFKRTRGASVKVTPQGRTPRTYGILEGPEGADVTLRIPILAQNKQTTIEVTETGRRIAITGFDWEGFFTSRGRRL